MQDAVAQLPGFTDLENLQARQVLALLNC